MKRKSTTSKKGFARNFFTGFRLMECTRKPKLVVDITPPADLLKQDMVNNDNRGVNDTKAMGNTQQRLIQNSENSKEHEKASKFNCQICMEPISEEEKFNIQNGCSHNFCMDCITKYIEVQIKDNVSNVKCPGLTCKNLLDPLTCRGIIPESLFIRWCDILCYSAQLAFQNCYCPNRECSVSVINECGGTVDRTKCPNCKKLFCFQCRIPWHEGYRCRKSRQMIDMKDILFMEEARRSKFTRCPACYMFVERTWGCSIVTCRCRTEFCHHCGKKCHTHSCNCKRYIRDSFCMVMLGIFLVFGIAGSLMILSLNS